jgi:hypothetical protein
MITHANANSGSSNQAVALDACRLATTGANLSVTAAGSRDTKILVANANGAFSLDSISGNLLDRVLVKDQTNGVDNGIYFISILGDASHPYVLMRTPDSNTSLLSGTTVYISGGALNIGNVYTLSTPDIITLDTTALTFILTNGVGGTSPNSPIKVNPSVINNFVSFSDTVGNQKDSGNNISSFDAAGTAATVINAHKDLTTGVHGVGAGTIAKVSDITATQAGAEPSGAVNTHNALTTGVHGVGAGTVAKISDITAAQAGADVAGTAAAAVNAHKDLTTGVHGVGAGTVAKVSDITATQAGAEPSGAVNTHNALTTGVHGVGAGTVAKISDITAAQAGADATGTAAAAVNGHKDLTTGVHGVGAGTIAKISDITATQAGAEPSGAVNTHNALTTGVHGVGAGTVAKISDITAAQAGAEPSGAVNTHNALTTGVHGVGAGTVAKLTDITYANAGAPAIVNPSVTDNFVGFSNTTGSQKDSGKNAASFEPSGNVATHAALTTGVHGVGAGTIAKVSDITATQAGAEPSGAVNTHNALTTGVHGVGAGSVAGTTLTQTLTNKTLTAPTISDFTNANHTHTGASSGGSISGTGGLPQSSLDISNDNINLAMLLRLQAGSLPFQRMVNCMADGFADQTGIDTTNSINQVYGTQLYTPVGLAYTTALLRFNGANNGTVFTDTTGLNTWTAASGAVTTTDQHKFGTASGQFNGSSSLISAPAGANFNVGTNDFTIDFWVKRASTSSSSYICGQFDGTNLSTMQHVIGINSNNTITWEGYLISDSSLASTATITDTTTWHHIALVRYGANLTIYLDGTSIATRADLSGINFASSSYNFTIGRAGNLAQQYFNGYIDEFRFSKGIARWTANFTPPTTEYQSVDMMTLLTNAYTALSAPSSYIRVLLLQEDPDVSNVNAVNTDFKVYASMDNGTNYYEVTGLAKAAIYAAGATAAGKCVYTGSLSTSGMVSGTSIKAKIVTLGKNINIRGIALNWI